MDKPATHKKTKPMWWVLLAALVATELIKLSPSFIEEWYAQWFYPPVAKGLRWLLGWIPFSVGDLLIGILVVWMIMQIIKGIRCWKAGNATRNGSWRKFTQVVFGLGWAYVLFHFLWGFNYYRKGSAWLLNIQTEAYNQVDIDTLLTTLNTRLQKICIDSALIEQSKTNDRKELRKQAAMSWDEASKQYAFMQFSQHSLKANLLGPLQSYTGYGGYLFPYTGEAQVDFYVPAYVLPFTVCHEMAHQQGFGSESEANMIGFLAARTSKNPAFVYSAYADMFDYALREMYRRDTTMALQWRDSMPGLLKKDRKQLWAYYQSKKNPVQPLLDWVYNNYLLRTNQPEGLQSYNRVVAWLIAYGKKYGWQSL
jgi:hypothetical protein